MDPMLYPYINSIEVDLIKRKKQMGKNHLAFTDSLFTCKSSRFEDLGLIDGKEIENVYKDDKTIYHVVDFPIKNKSYKMSLDMDRRKENMALNLAQSLTIMVFKKLFSINFHSFDGEDLVFEKQNSFNLEDNIKNAEKTIQAIILAGLDTRTFKKADGYYISVPGLAKKKIYYPSLANTSELIYLYFDRVRIDDDIRISLLSYKDLLSSFENTNNKLKQIAQLLGSKDIDHSFKKLVDNYQAMEKDLATTRDSLYSYYSSFIDTSREIKGISYLTHKIEDKSISELSRLASMLDVDIALLAKLDASYSSVLIKNSTAIKIEDLMKKYAKIYPMKIYKDKVFIRARVESKYLDRLMDTFEKDIREILNKR